MKLVKIAAGLTVLFILCFLAFISTSEIEIERRSVTVPIGNERFFDEN